MIEEIQKRPFVRPLFLWITGILCYAFLPASSLLYVLGVLSALVFLFLGFPISSLFLGSGLFLAEVS